MKLTVKNICFTGFFSLLSILGSAVEISEPSGFPILKKKGFVVQYDSRNKIPLWTWEVLDASKLVKNAERKGIPFVPDPDIYPLHQAQLNDYKRSGRDRGHMVPAADVSFSQEALANSFFLTNVCPQNAKLNRGFWLRLERHMRDLQKSELAVFFRRKEKIQK